MYNTLTLLIPGLLRSSKKASIKSATGFCASGSIVAEADERGGGGGGGAEGDWPGRYAGTSDAANIFDGVKCVAR